VSDEEGALTRRRVPVGELHSLARSERVLGALVDARLLTASDGEIELSHEALLREWPRYRVLLEEDQVGRRLHAHLAEAAREWDARRRDPAELYRGARLAGALEWAAHHDDQLNTLEREFIDSSRLEAERGARQQRSQNRRLRGLVLGVGALLVVVVVAGVIALIKQQSASHEARVALARQLGAEAVNEPRLDVAMLLAREAVNLDRSPQTEGSLLAALLRSPAAIGTFAFPVSSAWQLVVSPDGGTLAASALFGGGYFAGAGTVHGEVRFYDARTLAALRPRLGDFGGARPVYSSDGSLLAYPTQDYPESIAVRDAHTLALRAKLAFDPFQISLYTPDLTHATILISPDRRSVYCAYRVFDSAHKLRAAYVDHWSLPNGRRLSTTRIGGGRLLAVGLIDGGARLAIVDPRSVGIFDASSLQRLSSVPITPAPPAPSAAAVNPDGRQIAIGSPNGQVSFVDSPTGVSHPGRGVHASSVTNIAYSPDGRVVVATGSDNKVTVWDPRSATSTEVLAAPGGEVQGVAVSPDSSTLYTSSPGGVGIEWDLSGNRGFGRRAQLGPAPLCCGPVSPPAPPFALSPDGAAFATPVGTGTVGLFSTRTLQRLGSFKVGTEGSEITALAWSPAGSELGVAGHSGLVELWRVGDHPRLLRRLVGLQPPLSQPEAIQALAYSPDGQLLAATDNAETLQSPQMGVPQPAQFQDHLARLALWSAGSGKLLTPQRDLGPGPAPFDTLALSADGKLLAVSVLDGSVQILDPSTGKIRRTLQPLGADDTVSMAFAPNGTLATGTLSGIVQLWNPVTGAQIARPVPVADGPVTSIAFDPSGQRFATTGDNDGTAKLWSTATLQQQGTALATDAGQASNVKFASNGASLLAITNHGVAVTWPTSLAAWTRRACSIAGRNFSPQEWSRYVPASPYTRICP
jgi:WD40 repeat protein